MQEAEDEDDDEDIDNPAKFVTQVGVSKELLVYRLAHQVVLQLFLTAERKLRLVEGPGPREQPDVYLATRHV